MQPYTLADVKRKIDEAEALIKDDLVKGVFINPDKYGKLLSDMRTAKGALSSNETEGVKIHIIVKDLGLSLDAAKRELDAGVHLGVFKCVEDLLTQLSQDHALPEDTRSKIHPELTKFILREVRFEMVRNPRAYAISARALAPDSQQKIYDKLEKNYGIVIPRVEREKALRFLRVRTG
jgi:hypothetical protein